MRHCFGLSPSLSAWPSQRHVNPITCAWAPSRRRFNGLRAHGGVGAHVQGLTCERRTMSDTVVPKLQTTLPTAAHCQRFSPRWSAVWRPHRLPSGPGRHQMGGNGVIRGVTRRRHAASHLLMLQNPHRRRCGRYCETDEIGGDYLAWSRRGVAGDERPVIGDMDGAERTQDSRNKNRAGPLRYKTRPADPFSPDLRYKTLPARSKSPYLTRFARAGRTLYRCHQQEAVRGELCTEYKSETGVAITVHQAPPVWRARRAWLRCSWEVVPGRAIYSDPAPLVWKAPEGLEGRAAAHGHTKQPGTQRQHTARGPKRRSASGPSRVSVAHRLSWM